MSTEQSPAGSYRATAFADAKPEHAAPGATPERLEHLWEHGFVIVTDFVDSHWIPVLREAGRRVTEACAPANGYRRIDCSKGYVHRAGEDEPWAIRGIIHPAFNEPCFAEFLGSEEFLDFVAAWCHGLGREDLVMSSMLLWCNPRVGENRLGWHRDVTWWGTGEAYFAQREVRGEGPEAYSEEIERIRWKEIQEKQRAVAHGTERRQHLPGAGGRRVPRVDTDQPPALAHAVRARRAAAAGDEGAGCAAHAQLERRGSVAGPGRDPAQGGGSAGAQRCHDSHRAHRPRTRAQHALDRLVAVVGPVRRRAVGGGRAQRLATRSRRARGVAARLDEDRLGPLGGDPEAGGYARGPLSRVRHRPDQGGGSDRLARRAGTPGRGSGGSGEAIRTVE